MSEKKPILKSVYRPDFKIPQITKLEGIKTKEKRGLSDRFSSPIFGRIVPDVIVVPEFDNELSDTGRRLDAFRDNPRVKKKDDYSDFHIIDSQARVDILGGKNYKIEPEVIEREEVVKEQPTISQPVFREVVKEVEIPIEEPLEIKPLEEIYEEPKPGIYAVDDEFVTKAGFEFYNDENIEEETIPVVKIEKPVAKKVAKKTTKYILPNPEMFEVREKDIDQTPEWLLNHINTINETLESFNIDGKVMGHVKGPTVTRYEVSLGPGVRSNRLTSISDNLQMNLQATSIRIETPVPGKPFAGLEVPNVNPEMVPFGNVVNDKEFLMDKEHPLKVALGVDIDGDNVYVDIAKMPHGLIAGATNSGKSVCVNTLLASLLIKNRPDELKLILIDPKFVELSAYNDLPHLVTPVITEPKMASEALKWVVNEMESRYKKFAANRSRDIKSYNDNIKAGRIDEVHMPYIVIVIDELADLMNVAANDVEQAIQRITQKARAAGIHLIVATQRPSTDVVKGTIKSNIPSRIAFRVASHVDSSTILDGIGAEKLLGKGDMLLKGADRLIRLQGAYIPDHEIYELTDFIREQAEVSYEINHEDLTRRVNNKEVEKDELFDDVARFVVTENVASINRITTEFSIGFNRAQNIVKMLEDYGIVSEQEGTKSRDVLISLSQLEDVLNDENI